MDECSLLTSRNDVSIYNDKTDSAPKSPDSISSHGSKLSATAISTLPAVSKAEDRSEDLEPTLRRSKRGKGRPGNSHGNNDGSSDDHVASCVVSEVEYKTGDFVYYEEPDFEYFTIGLIEEIKISRRDKYSIYIKCFYRTRDVPETAKQALPDRDNYQSHSKSKAFRDIFSRELFISEVQETLPSKQLRGRCRVTYMPDLKTALKTFKSDEEDSFYYVFAYNPESRRLSKIRAEIRVGNVYQASLPLFRHETPAIYRFNSNRRRFRRHRRPLKRPHDDDNGSLSDVKSKSSRLTDEQSQQVMKQHGEDVSVNKLKEANNEQWTKKTSSVSPSIDLHNLNEDAPHRSKGSNQNSDSDYLKKSDSFVDNSVLPPKLESVKDWDDGDEIGAVSCGHRHSSYHRRHKSTSHRHHGKRQHPVSSRETLLWNPVSLHTSLSRSSNNHHADSDDHSSQVITDESLKNYLDAVRSMVAFFGFGGAENDLASAENGLVLANLAATTQHAYDTLHQCNYSLRDALQTISCNPIVAKDTPRHWTTEQVRLFAHALRTHGKDFFAIQRNFFGGRSSSTATTGLNRPWIQNVTAPTSVPNTTGRVRGRGRRKNGILSVNKSVNKLDETEFTNNQQDGFKPDPLASVTTSRLNDALMDVESTNSTSNLPNAAADSASTSNSSLTCVSNEPVKTVKQLIAFYYYWKRKGASSCNLGHGGLTAAAGNFATAVAAAATLNNSNNADSHNININHNQLSTKATTSTVSTNSFAATSISGLILDGNHSPNSQSSLNGKKRKTINRGCASMHNSVSTPLSEQSESVGATLPESEIDENATVSKAATEATSSSGLYEPVDSEPVTSGLSEKYDKPTNSSINSSTQDNATSQCTTIDSLALTGRDRHLTCRNCDQALSQSSNEASSPMLRLLCINCRTYFQKYGELKFTSDEQDEEEEEEEEVNPVELSSQLIDDDHGDGNRNVYEEPPQLDCASSSSTTTGAPVPVTEHTNSKQSKGMKFTTDTRSTSNASHPEGGKHIKTEYLTYSPPRAAHRPETASYFDQSDSLSPTGSYSASASSPASSYLFASNLSSQSSSQCGFGESSASAECKSVANSECDSPPPPSDFSLPAVPALAQAHPTVSNHTSRSYTSSDNPNAQHQQLSPKTMTTVGAPSGMIDDDNVCATSCPTTRLASSSNTNPVSQCKLEQLVSVSTTTASLDSFLLTSSSSSSHLMMQNGVHSVSSQLNESIGSGVASVVDQTATLMDSRERSELSNSFVTSSVNQHHQFNASNQSVTINKNNYESNMSPCPDDIELGRILAAAQCDPLPCYMDAHRSTWAHLVRVWDRRVKYAAVSDSNHVMTNIGSCARTDLIYNGRGLAIPQSNKEFWDAERSRLYASYADTIIGPGATIVDTLAGDSSKPPFSVSATSSRTDNAGLNLTISTATNLIEASQNALDLCARHLKQPSPSVYPVSFGSNMSAQKPSMTSSVSLPRNMFPPTVGKPMDSVQSQQHLQAVYDQALLLAAAAASANANNNNNQPQPCGPMRDFMKSAQQPAMLDPQSTHFPASSSSRQFTPIPGAGNSNQTAMTARLGAAAGTFYPPTMSNSTVNNHSGISSTNTTTTNANNINNKAIINDAHILSNLHSHAALTLGTNTNQSINYPGRDSIPNPHRSSTSPFYLQRQLAMMGLIPSTSMTCESASSALMEQREMEALQRALLEKMEYLRNAASQRGLTPVEQYQLLQQRELLIAAFASEMASRRTDSNNALFRQQQQQQQQTQPANAPFQPSIASLLPVGCGNGAMTSAVNSISTRPTASVQSPHPRLPQVMQYSTPTTRFVPNQSDSHLMSEMSAVPNAASIQQPSRDNNNLGFVLPPNYMAMFSQDHQTPNNPSSRGAHTSNCPTPPNNSPQLTGGRAAHRAVPNQQMDLQEQVLNAAKMAMMAASMQSDQNKALTFANLAAAAFAEMAANQERNLPVSPRSTLPIPSPCSVSSLVGQVGNLPETMTQRAAHQQALHHPQLNQLSSPVNLGMRSPMGTTVPDNNLLMSNLMNQNIHKNMTGTRQLRPSSTHTPNPHHQAQHPNRPVTPLYPHVADARPLTGVPTISTVSGNVNRPNTTNLPIPTPAQLAQFAQLSGLSFQDQTVFNAFALAAAATSLVSGNGQADPFTDGNDPPPADRYRSAQAPANLPHRHNSSQHQQQQALANAFGIPHNLSNHHLPSAHH